MTARVTILCEHSGCPYSDVVDEIIVCICIYSSAVYLKLYKCSVNGSTVLAKDSPCHCYCEDSGVAVGASRHSGYIVMCMGSASDLVSVQSRGSVMVCEALDCPDLQAGDLTPLPSTRRGPHCEYHCFPTHFGRRGDRYPQLEDGGGGLSVLVCAQNAYTTRKKMCLILICLRP